MVFSKAGVVLGLTVHLLIGAVLFCFVSCCPVVLSRDPIPSCPGADPPSRINTVDVAPSKLTVFIVELGDVSLCLGEDAFVSESKGLLAISGW